MRKKRFTEEKIIGVLKEAEVGIAVAELCRKHGICEQTYYSWKSKCGGLQVSESRRPRQLEEAGVADIDFQCLRSAKPGGSAYVPGFGMCAALRTDLGIAGKSSTMGIKGHGYTWNQSWIEFRAPNAQGVYCLADKHGEVIFIGKGNICERLLRHWNQENPTDAEIWSHSPATFRFDRTT